MKRLFYFSCSLPLLAGWLFACVVFTPSGLAQSGLPLLGVGYTSGAAPAATPGFVNETSFNSTTSAYTVTTLASGTTSAGCPAYSACIPYPDGALSGNLGIIVGTFANSTTLTPTAIDDQAGDSYTCTTGGTKDTGTNEWPYLCYAPNLTAGAHKTTTTFGTTSVTQVADKLAQFYNIATSSPLDGSIGSCAAASSSTANCASVTTTQANDLIFVMVCRAGTPAVTSFTAGSGFILKGPDILDGCATEYEVDSGTGSITPSMTMASSSTYIEIVAAFKSATAGTAPPATPYLKQLMSWGYTTVTAGNRSFQFTNDAGDLLVETNTCNTVQPTGITDSTNTWVSAGTIYHGSGNYTIEFYVANASANGTGLLTVNASSVSGDCNYYFYDFGNAPTAPVVARASFNSTTGFSQTPPLVSYPGYDFSGGSQIGPFLPAPTVGISVTIGGQNLNTSVALSSSAQCTGDMAIDGGDPESGPWPRSQNNPVGHCYYAGAAASQWTWPQTNASTQTGGNSEDIVAFWGTTGIGIKNSLSKVGTTTSIALTVPSTTAGNAGLASISGTSGLTLTSLCLDGTTCAAGNVFTCPAGAHATAHGGGPVWACYNLNMNGGKTVLTATFGGTHTHTQLFYQEIQDGNSGGSWSLDGTAETSTGAGGSSAVCDGGYCLTGATITTTGTNDACVAAVSVGGSVIFSPTYSPANSFLYGGTIFTLTGDAAASILTTTSGSQIAKFSDSTSGDSFSMGGLCVKGS